MKSFMLFAVLLGLTSLGWAESRRDASTERLVDAGKVLRRIMDTPATGIPKEILNQAKCIAVVPHMVEGGFVLGAESGRGVATCRTADGWSAPVFFTVEGGSVGLQLGIEGVGLVMVFQNDKGMERLLSSKFELGADVSASAGPVGGHVSADTDWKLDTEILTYSYARGAFAGLALTGASIRRDDDSMQAIYRHNVTTRSVLLGEVAAPEAALPFMSAVRETIAKPKVQSETQAVK
jgi:lipid-binding SYLF domain-containing protein